MCVTVTRCGMFDFTCLSVCMCWSVCECEDVCVCVSEGAYAKREVSYAMAGIAVMESKSK